MMPAGIHKIENHTNEGTYEPIGTGFRHGERGHTDSRSSQIGTKASYLEEMGVTV